MAQAFKRQTSRSIGTSATRIGNYTVGVNISTTAIGLSIANTSTVALSCSVYHSDGTNNTYLVYGAPIPVGGSLVVIGGDQKHVLQAGDSLFCSVTTAVSGGTPTADALLSVLELS